MAANKNQAKYDPNGRYRVLRNISHPQAKHADGCIRPERDDPEGKGIVVNLAHHKDNQTKIVLLVEQLKAFEYLGPAEKNKS